MKRIRKYKLVNFILSSISKWQIKIILVAFALVIVFTAIIYTNLLVRELVVREKNLLILYTEIYKLYISPDINPEQMLINLDVIAPTISFPMIYTDENDVPNYPFDQHSLNIEIDTTLSIQDQREYMQEYVNKMKSNYPPIIIEDPEQKGKILTKCYYTHSVLIDQLQLFPVVEVLIVAVFILIGYMAFSNIRRSEQTKVWVGMAKEAAHQLGTPLSSMLAWMEIMKMNKDNPDSIDETIAEMENDINRLLIIANRFSKIGSKPEIRTEDLSLTIEEVCQYFEKRLPHIGKKVSIIRELDPSVTAPINPELFAWVIENLLKNAAEAIESKQGSVKIILKQPSKRKVEITVTDDGKGMSMMQKRQAFLPGFTSKKRGWGLGLSLSKRIVEEYHNGKIFIKDTAPGKGTTFAIELPIMYSEKYFLK